MKLPSLAELAGTTTATLRRFPLVMVSASILTILLFLALDESRFVQPGFALAACLGLSLFLGLDLVSERIGSRGVQSVLWVLGAGALIAYAVYVGDKPEEDLTEVYRFALLLLVVHLFVAVGPFVGKGSVRAFWDFNKTLFLRFLLAILFSGVLFGGLAVAMLAVDHLLLDGSTFPDKAYGRLFFVCGVIFNTLFFLAGIPRDFALLEEEREYPKGLKIFAQNLLLPLVVLYMAILYLYAITILVKWEWPEGWVGWLVLSFSVLGILALLLLYPLQKRSDSAWIARFSRWYYVAVLPLIGLLFAAIVRRIAEYGITENRYFVVLLALWLGGVAIYFIASRRKNIKIVPISLAAVALLSSFGPWGAFAVSTRSQAARFEELVVRNALLTNGKIDSTKGAALDDEVQHEMMSILQYLEERDDLDRVSRYFAGGAGDEDPWTLGSEIGIYRGGLLAERGREQFWIQPAATDSTEIHDIRDFDVLIRRVNYNGEKTSPDEYQVLTEIEHEGAVYVVTFRPDEPELLVTRNGENVVRFDVDSAIAARLAAGEGRRIGTLEWDAARRTITGEGGNGLLVVEELSGSYRQDDGPDTIAGEVRVSSLQCSLLLGGLATSRTP